MSTRSRPVRPMRGQPVLALAAVLVVWAALRVAFWQSPLALPVSLPEPPAGERPAIEQPATQAPAGPARLPSATLPPAFPPPPDWKARSADPAVTRPLEQLPERYRRLSRAGEPATPGRPVPSRLVAGHTMLLAAGLTQLPVPPAIEHYLTQGPLARPAGDEPQTLAAASGASGVSGERVKRWSMDGWLLLREDRTRSLAAVQPGYGRSQVGAVVRYRLAPGGRHRPQVQLRASSALAAPREQEVALGISARPVPGLPVRVAAEGRLTDRAGGSDVRAAAYAVTELPPLSLPGNLTGEAYLQAGYVSGEFATAFVDGQARVTRELGELEAFRLQAGGGAWGGAQEGASRLDIGPSVSASFRVGEGYGRVSADYRFRVAGDAAPVSGPALTVSVGF